MIKKIFFPLLVISLLTACNNAGEEDHSKHESKDGKAVVKAPVDSLLDEVMAGHDEVMPKMGKVRGAQARAKAMLDSIAELPAKAQDAAVDLKKKLETLVNDLNYADAAMYKWMTEFNRDSVVNNLQERLKYLENEKGKVSKVKEAVLGGLARADSLFKAKLKP